MALSLGKVSCGGLFLFFSFHTQASLVCLYKLVIQKAAAVYAVVGVGLNGTGIVFCVLNTHYDYIGNFGPQIVVYSLAALAPYARRPWMYYPLLVSQVCTAHSVLVDKASCW